MFRVSEPNGHSNAEDHEHPVDLRDIDLAVYLIGGVNNLDSWKTTK